MVPVQVLPEPKREIAFRLRDKDLRAGKVLPGAATMLISAAYTGGPEN